MKPSEILKLAARIVERGEKDCGCDAIGWAASGRVGHYPPDNVMEFFLHLYPQDGGSYYCETWWGSFRNRTHRSPANRNARIIGLCLAAAIAESEGQ